MNELEEVKTTNIEEMIYEIRGVQVMLDSDLAKLYQCKNGTKDINKAVKRNINRFPNDFYFQLTKEECSRFQIGTLNKSRGENLKYLPHVFSEEGVAMLASVLHTNIAEQTSVNIMKAFVRMRQYISNNLIEQKYYKNMLLSHDSRISLLEESFEKLNEKQKVNTIFYKGQIFDAYIALMEIFESAKKEIIIIDDYAGKELLKILKAVNKKIIIVSKNINSKDIKKYESQYNNVKIKISNEFHDRFIIIDRSILYHSGASFKDLGKRCFAINKIEDSETVNKFVEKISK